MASNSVEPMDHVSESWTLRSKYYDLLSNAKRRVSIGQISGSQYANIVVGLGQEAFREGLSQDTFNHIVSGLDNLWSTLRAYPISYAKFD